jgi:hypothetical protein
MGERLSNGFTPAALGLASGAPVCNLLAAQALAVLDTLSCSTLCSTPCLLKNISARVSRGHVTRRVIGHLGGLRDGCPSNHPGVRDPALMREPLIGVVHLSGSQRITQGHASSTGMGASRLATGGSFR